MSQRSALIDDLSSAVRKRFDRVHAASLEALMTYDWPGNVRELRNVLERAMILSHGPILTVFPPAPLAAPSHAEPGVHAQAAAPVPPQASADASPSTALGDMARAHILRILEQTGWRIRGRHAAADLLGLKPTTLEARMQRLGIRRPALQRPR